MSGANRLSVLGLCVFAALPWPLSVFFGNRAEREGELFVSRLGLDVAENLFAKAKEDLASDPTNSQKCFSRAAAQYRRVFEGGLLFESGLRNHLLKLNEGNAWLLADEIHPA